MARCQPALDEGGAGRQRQRGLGDVVAGVGEDAQAEFLDLGLGGCRPDQHPVAAGAVDFLHHQFVQVLQRVLEVLRIAQDAGRHVVQDRLLAQVEADHLRHVRIHRLVVAHAGAGRVRKGHVAGAIGLEQAGHAQHRLGAEHPRIQVVVVDPPVQHVHALRAAGGAHVDHRIAHEQVRALDQFHAHLLGKERMLEVSGVARARGQHSHHRIVHAGRRGLAQGVQQHVRVALDRRDLLAREQVRQQPRHHPAVLQHVRHPGRHPQVVLQHEVLAIAGTDQVDPGDVRIHAAGHFETAHLLPVFAVVEHQVARHAAFLEDPLLTVDIAQEQVQRMHALAQPGFQHPPFDGGDDPRHQVEGDQALVAGFLAVHRESDADPVEGNLRLAPLVRDFGFRRAVEPIVEGAVVRAHPAQRVMHLVVRNRHPTGQPVSPGRWFRDSTRDGAVQ